MARKRRAPILLGDEALRLVSQRFRALSDPTRLRLLNHLMRGEQAVQDLAEAAELEQPNVSRHLAVLRNDGLVERRSDGNRALYSLADPSAVRLVQVACGGLADRLSESLEALEDDGLFGDGI